MIEQPEVPYTTAADVAAGVAAYDAHAVRGVVATPRYRLAYVDWMGGDRGTILFVHGLSDQARSFAMVMHRLVAAGWRCVGVELADGRHDGANLGTYRHRHHADDIVVLLDHLRLGTINVFASSYGSTVALRLLTLYPGRVRRCVLQGGFARRPLKTPEIAAARLARFLPGTMADLPRRDRAMAAVDGPQFAGADPAAYRFMLACSGRSPIRAVADRAVVLSTLDLRPLLPAVKTPILMVGGAADRIVPRWCEGELEAGLAAARRIELPGGHYPQYTLPGPTAAAVLGFVGGSAADPL